ncbi:sulfite exporter TauE/SafE family protein [Vampirovibrio chlorellavorus]|uniref:sulfite exporter TauE/SafE family protein n=1 Tax=Vampirovibrio chlorellavorus TaxID=758823 RepID=UPI0026E9AD2D|nr:sulfite exporter TauE/SafE family protein [Vampirovibrio chlorellavorus]
MMWILTLFWGLLIGLILGLLGGGGALVSIPILLYAFHFPFREAVGASLLLVVLGALPSLLLYWRQKEVDLPAALWMGLGGSVGAFLGSQFASSIPQAFLMQLLIGLILLSVWRLYCPAPIRVSSNRPVNAPGQILKLLMAGLAIGVLTGLVGVGGGFLIVPALILFHRSEPRRAIATSLLIICLNAASGTLGYWTSLPWGNPIFYGLMFSTVIGSLQGFALSRKVGSHRLKQGFGLLLLLIAILLLVKPPVA